MLIAPFGPWVELLDLSRTGFSVEGAATLLGLWALAAAGFFLYAGRVEERALFLSALAGALGVLLALGDLRDFDSAAGWGVWAFLLGCAGQFVTSLLLWRRHGSW
jgi:hypothetical protein